MKTIQFIRYHQLSDVHFDYRVVGSSGDLSGVYVLASDADRKNAALEAELKRLRETLELARNTITEMEEIFKKGKLGFSCDVIDQIDNALAGKEE